MVLKRGAVAVAIAVGITSVFGGVSAQQRGRCIGSFQVGARPIPVSLDSLRAAGSQDADLQHPPVIRLAVLADATLSDANLREYGWRLIARVGDVATVEGPAAAAPYLGALHGIRYISTSSHIHTVMDSVRRCCYVDQVHKTKPGWSGPRLTGKKVLFGTIDTDFDTRHKAFRDSSGATRFVAIWDQQDSTKKYPNRFKYGSIANHAQLLTDTAFGLNKGFHGTCMASYAAGGQWSSPFYGVAPDVTIAAVKMGQSDQNIIDGLNWLFTLADSLKRPCVVNMSLGSAEGPHDGSSLVDRAIDTLSKKPGHVVVGAVGNDGDKQSHLTFKLGKGQAAGAWAVPVPSGGYQYSEIEMWGQAGKSFVGTLCFLLDTTSGTFRSGSPSYSTANVPADSVRSYAEQRVVLTGTTDTVYVQVLALESASALNGKPHMEVAALTRVSGLYFGIRDSAAAAGDTIQVWNGYSKALKSFRMTGFADGDTIMSTNELGGTARHNITVGGYTDKTMSTLWNGQPTPGSSDDLGVHRLAHFSGRGPTVDGRIKPDICSPAENVVGALARDIDSSSVNIMYWPDHPATDDRYAITGGTSCSSPAVAGIVAMMLEADSALTADSIKKILQATAYQDAGTGVITTPNNLWGAGKVSALGAIGKELHISAVREIAQNRNAGKSALSLLSGNRVKFLGSTEGRKVCFEYFSLLGRCVRRQPILTERTIDCYSTLPAGIYFLRVREGDAELGSVRITTAGK